MASTRWRHTALISVARTLAGLMVAAVSPAAIPALSDAQRESQAIWVLEGTVLKIDTTDDAPLIPWPASRPNRRLRRFDITVQPTRARPGGKGQGVEGPANAPTHVQAYQTLAGQPGPQGTDGLQNLSIGTRVRFYLTQATGALGWKIMEPNGLVILDAGR